ncbi:MAG: hypothetical protein PUP91_16375 [Rhizonema sp. PD37]|nr:hypothetical protein [Rhizonema sp. PD37]
MYHFTESDLNIKSVSQLKDVYIQIGCTLVVTDKRIKANWVQTILVHQLAQIEKVIVATVVERPKTYTDCPSYQPFSDGTHQGQGFAFDSVVRDQKLGATTVHSGSLIFKPATEASAAYEVWNGDVKYGIIRMLEDGLWTHSYGQVIAKYSTPYEAAAALIEAVQLRQKRSADIVVLERWDDKFVVRNIQNGCHYIVQPNHPDPKERCECGDCHFRKVTCKHQNAVADHTKIESFSEDIEVDSVSDPDFGLLYRVWKSGELLGTFYHAFLDGKWVAQPCESDARPRCETAYQAQLLILAVAGLLVAGKVDEDRIFCPASFT